MSKLILQIFKLISFYSGTHSLARHLSQSRSTQRYEILVNASVIIYTVQTCYEACTQNDAYNTAYDLGFTITRLSFPALSRWPSELIRINEMGWKRLAHYGLLFTWKVCHWMQWNYIRVYSYKVNIQKIKKTGNHLYTYMSK